MSSCWIVSFRHLKEHNDIAENTHERLHKGDFLEGVELKELPDQ